MTKKEVEEALRVQKMIDLAYPPPHMRENIKQAQKIQNSIPQSVRDTIKLREKIIRDNNISLGSRQSYISQYVSQDVKENTEYYEVFLSAMKIIENLLKVSISSSKEKLSLNKLLFANAITAMEVYLSDAFTNTILNNEKYFQNFIQTTPEFNDKKIKLSQIYEYNHKKLEGLALKYLSSVIYHNIHKVKKMYEETLNISFPDKIEDIQKSILIRHDIAHRNGKKKEDGFIEIQDNQVDTLIKLLSSFVENIDQQLQKL